MERPNNRGDSTKKEEVRRRKIRKFASRQGTKNNQTDGSKTEATLILCGYSGERANIQTVIVKFTLGDNDDKIYSSFSYVVYCLDFKC